MADEKKTYLVNVESNLAKYAQDAADAKKKVDELRTANDLLKQSGEASADQVEASNAALRNAQKEYNQAKKMVDLQTAANNSEKNSRKQLSEILKLQQQELGKLGNAYIKDAQGIMKLNPVYAEQRNRIKATQDAIRDYDLALGDGRSNVGRYGEAVSEAFKSAGQSVLSMVSPMALITAGITVAAKIFEGLKNAIMDTEAAVNILNITSTVTRQIFADLVHTGGINIDNLMVAADVAKTLNEIRMKERIELIQNAKIERDIAKLEFDAADKTKTRTEREKALNEAIRLQNLLSDKKIKNAYEEANANYKLLSANKDSKTLLDKQSELNIQLIKLDEERFDLTKRNEAKVTAFEQQKIDDRKKLTEAWYKEIEAMNIANEKYEKGTKEYEDMQNAIAELIIEKSKLADLPTPEEIKGGLKYTVPGEGDVPAEIAAAQFIADEKERIWQENLAAGKAIYEQDIQLAQNQASKELAIALEVLDQKQTLADAEIAIAAGVGGLLSTLAGKHGGMAIAAIAVEKAAAIAQVISNVTIANAKAVALSPMTAGQPWVSINTAFGAISVANMIAQAAKSIAEIRKQGGSGDGGSNSSMPVAITTSSARPTAGSSILNQPQLSQSQLNSIPNQNLLTADDIIRALQNMPAPVVTVEDINARSRAVERVNVRANI
jgi:hypothetical protein